jgi:hypothetical protein
METSNNECPSESNDHLSNQLSENEEKQPSISFHMKATNSTQNKGEINIGKQRCPIQREYKKKGTFQAKLEMQRNFSLFTLNNIIYNSEATANIVLISKLDEVGCKTTIDKVEMLITFNRNLVY